MSWAAAHRAPCVVEHPGIVHGGRSRVAVRAPYTHPSRHAIAAYLPAPDEAQRSSPQAQAARIVDTANPNVVIIELSHADTVTAAQLGAGQVINAVLGNDNWGVILEDDSRYQSGSYYRPSKRTTWNNVTGQQVISEAAAHPGGRVVLAVYTDPSKSVGGQPLWVQQIW